MFCQSGNTNIRKCYHQKEQLKTSNSLISFSHSLIQHMRFLFFIRVRKKYVDLMFSLFWREFKKLKVEMKTFV